MAKKLQVTLFFLFFISLIANLALGQGSGVAYVDSTAQHIVIKGEEGWRMVTTPSSNQTFGDLFSGLWIQGVRGSDAPAKKATIFYWDETHGGSFEPVEGMNKTLENGKGYLLYAFKDDKRLTASLQGGFPKVIDYVERKDKKIVNVSVSATDANGNGTIDYLEGWNLLANPYNTALSVNKVLSTLERPQGGLNKNIYIWRPYLHHGNGAFTVLQNDEQIDPFQVFFIRYIKNNTGGNVIFNRDQLIDHTGASFYTIQHTEFNIRLGDGDKYDQFTVRFSPEGEFKEDLNDVYKLFSLNPHSINMFGVLGENTKLAINVLPPLSRLEGKIYIPLQYQLPKKGEYTFSWRQIKKLPRHVAVLLQDTERNITINLKNRLNYSFHYTEGSDRLKFGESKNVMLNRLAGSVNHNRFNLILASTNDEKKSVKMTKPVVLNPNYPNPFRNSTRLSFRLKEPSDVTLSIWNVVGQKVETIYKGKMMSKGEHYYDWKADIDLPSGIYICKLEAAGTVTTRKMTLIR